MAISLFPAAPILPSNLFNINLYFWGPEGEVPAARSLGHCRQAGLESQLTLQQAEERVICSHHGFLRKLSPAVLRGFFFSQSPTYCDLTTLAPIPSSAIYPISEISWEQHSQPVSQGLADTKLSRSLPGLASLSGFSGRAKDGVSLWKLLI